MVTVCILSPSWKFCNPPEMTESFQLSRSKGRPEELEKHWSSRTFSLFSSASFLGQSEPPTPPQLTPKEDMCWFSELQERESRPSEHHSRGGEPCSHPSWTLKRHTQEDKWWTNIKSWQSEEQYLAKYYILYLGEILKLDVRVVTLKEIRDLRAKVSRATRPIITKCSKIDHSL